MEEVSVQLLPLGCARERLTFLRAEPKAGVGGGRWGDGVGGSCHSREPTEDGASRERGQEAR